MGHPMMHHPSHSGSEDWTRMFFIPIPMAMFGVLTAFMFGASLGAMLGRKHAAMGTSGHGMMAWKHPMGMGTMGMGHHHHGAGPSCRCDDGSEGSSETVAEK